MASASSSSVQATDWTICVFCQLNTKESLISPTDRGYETIADNITQFSNPDSMPIKINLARLDHGNGIQSTLKEQNAKWHKSCYQKFSHTKLERSKRKHKSEEDGTASNRIFTCSTNSDGDTTSGGTVGSNCPKCFFCSQQETKEKLREVCTFQVDYCVRKCAHDLQDENLVKLSAGDLIAQEAKCHAKCLTNLYNSARAKVSQDQDASDDQICKGIALVELISYNEEKRQNEGVKVFRLADLVKLYTDRLNQLGVDVTAQVNSKLLKDSILMHLPRMKAYKEGRDVFMACDEDVGSILREGYQTDRAEQSVMMTQIAAQCTWTNWWSDWGFSGVLHHSTLWQDSNFVFHQWSQKESVHPQRTSDIRSTSNQGCSTATHEEGSTTRWAPLGAAPRCQNDSCTLQVSGDGLAQNSGGLCGLTCPKPVQPAQNYWSVLAEEDAQTANVLMRI